MEKNILVTGGAGQLGTAIYDYVQKNPNNKFNWFFTDKQANTFNRYLNISDKRDVENFIRDRIYIVINCAAFTNVEAAEDKEQRKLCYELNTEIPAYLAELSNKLNFKLIHISTDYVYDDSKNIFKKEDSDKHPKSWYGITKLYGENDIKENTDNFMIIRTSWLYYRKEFKNFVSTVLRIVGNDNPMSVVSDQIGSPTYAGDLTEFIVRMIYSENFLPKTTLNFSNKGEISWYDFAKEIAKSLNKEDLIKSCVTKEYPTKAKRPKYSVMDLSKTSEFSSQFDFIIPKWKTSLNKII